MGGSCFPSVFILHLIITSFCLVIMRFMSAIKPQDDGFQVIFTLQQGSRF